MDTPGTDKQAPRSTGDTPAVASKAVGASEPSRRSGSSWRHRLAGRKRWVALSALVGAAVGAAVGGWVHGQRTYRAQGFVQLGAVDGTTPNPVRADETVQRELSELLRLGGDAGQAEALVVGAEAIGGEAATRLRVTATADAPDAAREALRSVLAAYRATTALGEDSEQAHAYLKAAEALQTLRGQAANAEARLAEARAEAVTDDQTPADLDAAWSSASAALLLAQRDAEEAARRAAELEAMDEPTVAEVAALDPEAAAWFGRQRGLDQQLSVVAWPPAPAAAERLRERAELEAKLRARAADTRVLPVGDNTQVFRAVRISEARQRAEQADGRLRAAEAETAALEPRITRLRKLEAEAQRLAADVAKNEAEVASTPAGSGLELVATGFVPEADQPTAAVWRDTRPAMAGVGAALGAGAGALLAIAFFLADRRVRRGRDGGLVGSRWPLLSAVPVVGESAAPADEDADVATPWAGGPEVSSIQSIRAVLEGRMATGDHSFGVAGVASGSGATSVAVGLAASMALSGTRVLLIDLAWLQKPAGSGTDDEATRDGLGVDGVIEELGYLEDEDAEVLSLGGDEAVGFGALLEGASLRRSVVQTRLAALGVLSAMGRAEALRQQWAGRLSSRWLSKLLEVTQRGGYAATIVDAGSATGSVEGMLGCAAADGTVVVVSNEQAQTDYDRAVTRLGMVGATIIGTVLNRSGARRRSHDGGGAIGRGRATTGSGIFAAAVEARSGGGSGMIGAAGSGMFSAPLPAFEHDAEPTPTVSPDPTPSAFSLDDATIGSGVDPVDEPPTHAGPTPSRVPPTPAKPSADADAGPTEPADSPDTPDPRADQPAVHVTDDVMDQLVDHAIRRAARRPPPPAEAPSTTPPDA